MQRMQSLLRRKGLSESIWPNPISPMYIPQTCDRCGSEDLKTSAFITGLICQKCRIVNEDRRVMMFITPSEPESCPRSTSHEKWVWLILAMILIWAVMALSR